MPRLLQSTIIEEEITQELDSRKRGVERYEKLRRKTEERGDGANLKPAERLMLAWHDEFKSSIAQEKRLITQGVSGKNRRAYGLPFMLLPSAQMSVLAMHEVLGLLLRDTQPWTSTALHIGRAINSEWNIRPIKKAKGKAWKQLVKTSRCKLKPKEINRIANQHKPGSRWPLGVQVQLGSALLWLFCGVAGVESEDGTFIAAIERYKYCYNGKTPIKLRLSDEIRHIIDDGHSIRQHLRPRYQPMLLPPLHWKTISNGGYLKLKTPIVKRPSPDQLSQLRKSDMKHIYAGVNALGDCPWRINQSILPVVEDIWDAGGDPNLSIPPADPIPKPPRPDDYNENETAKKEWKIEAVMNHRLNIGLRGQRMEFLNKLTVAQKYEYRKQIFFPHNIDFRGRTYPIPLHLNHHGDDVCRGLLEFSDGHILSDRGKYWLAVHAANSFGIDKCSFDDRVSWVDEMCESIISSGLFPMDNYFWEKADKPWQFLAACSAWAQTNRPCHLPVQMDGSCNGLQHYAALSRDADGAAAVNLKPGRSPSDVYIRVANLVAALVESDAAKGKSIPGTLVDKITRPIVKQTVMTSVYGVTRSGGREQIKPLLMDAGIDPKLAWRSADYIATSVLQAMRGSCRGARELMDWLANCAKVIAKSNQTVRWITPLGLRCEQSYRKSRSKNVRTVTHVLVLNVDDRTLPVSYRDQVQGFPPNFIHSIDSSHLFMVAKEMRKRKLSFASVHDGFWCHANHVDEMHEILRDTFVELHSKPIIRQLYRWFCEEYESLEIPPPPAPGSFDITSVIGAAYAFA